MSSVTGAGVKEFFDAVDASRAEYEKCVINFTPHARLTDRVPDPREYLPELQRAREAREKSLNAVKEESLSRFMKDLTVDRERNPAAASADRWEEEEENDDDDDLDVNIIDRSECPSSTSPVLLRRFELALTPSFACMIR